jgi:hypothetical protein
MMCVRRGYFPPKKVFGLTWSCMSNVFSKIYCLSTKTVAQRRMRHHGSVDAEER